MNRCSIAIINQNTPLNCTSGKEAQDLALIFGSYEQKVSMFFIGDGVYHLLPKQQPELIGAKDYLKTYSAFEFYDIEDIYVCQQSLIQRKIDVNLSLNNVQLLTHEQLSNTLKQHKAVFTF